MKNNFLKVAVTATLVFIASFAAKAQIKLGDNLGNHKATKDLDLGDFQIYNTKGITIGGATTLTNSNIGLGFSGNKTIVVSNVATSTDITSPAEGMIIYDTTDDKFYLYQNGAWVTFALAMKESTDGITLASNPNGYTLTQEGEQMVLRLSPASEQNPGVVTSAGDQTFGGNKTFGGNVTVGSTSSTTGGADNLEVLGNTKVNKNLEVTGETDLTGDARLAGNLTVGGATATTTIQNALVVHGVTSLTSDLLIAPEAAVGDDSEVTLVVDKLTGEVRKTTTSPNSIISQSVTLTSITGFENNSTYDVTLSGVSGIKSGDAVFVSLTGVPGIVVFSAIASADEQITLTLGDLRQPPATGSLTPADTLLAGKSVLVTRYHQN